MIGCGSFHIRIEIGVCAGVLNCVISERLLQILSIDITFRQPQGVYKVLNSSDAILRKSLDFLDEFAFFSLILNKDSFLSDPRYPRLSAANSSVAL